MMASSYGNKNEGSLGRMNIIAQYLATNETRTSGRVMFQSGVFCVA